MRGIRLSAGLGAWTLRSRVWSALSLQQDEAPTADENSDCPSANEVGHPWESRLWGYRVSGLQVFSHFGVADEQDEHRSADEED